MPAVPATLQAVQELESRQDEVLRQLNELQARLEAVLREFRGPGGASDVSARPADRAA